MTSTEFFLDSECPKKTPSSGSIPDEVKKHIREAIIQSTAAAFKDPAVQARFQEWMTNKKHTETLWGVAGVHA